LNGKLLHFNFEWKIVHKLVALGSGARVIVANHSMNGKVSPLLSRLLIFLVQFAYRFLVFAIIVVLDFIVSSQADWCARVIVANKTYT
jgi:hypothetical protein